LICTMLLIGNATAADPERKVVHREEPEYPVIAARMSLHGTVRLKIWIRPDGTVRRMEYIGGHPLLAEAALAAVKTWRYQAAAQESTTPVALKF